MTDLSKLRHFSTAIFSETKSVTSLFFFIFGGWQRGDRDPVSRTNFNKIHASRFESVIVGETSGKRNFHDKTQFTNHAYLMK